MSNHALADRLLQALVNIHHTPARIIAAPPTSQTSTRPGGAPAKGKRASVAISGLFPAPSRKEHSFVDVDVSVLRVRPSGSPREAQYSDEAPSDPSGHHGSPTLQHFQDSSLLRSRVQSTSSLAESARELPVNPTVARLQDFFALPWVQSGTPEILYIKRATRTTDRWSAQVAFPGGRQEPEDENALYTAMRETWEEVGIDLAEQKEYLEIGQLDDREITTSLGKRLLMVLSPFIFLHTSPEAPVPDIQASEVASAHWIPLTCLLAPHVRWGDVRIDITSRITPRNRIIRKVLALLTGNMHFKSILLPNDPITSPDSSPSHSYGEVATASERPPLSLWGLTLGMSLDLLSHMSLPDTSDIKKTIVADRFYGNSPPSTAQPEYFHIPPTPHSAFPPLLAPSMTSIFPTFSYPDINFFIYVFGFRYRHLVKRWNDRIQRQNSSTPGRPGYYRRPSVPGTPGPNSHGGRVNFAGMALNQFYAAVRKALVLAIILRASVLLGGTGAAIWWLRRRLQERRRVLLS